MPKAVPCMKKYEVLMGISLQMINFYGRVEIHKIGRSVSFVLVKWEFGFLVPTSQRYSISDSRMCNFH